MRVHTASDGTFVARLRARRRLRPRRLQARLRARAAAAVASGRGRAGVVGVDRARRARAPCAADELRRPRRSGSCATACRPTCCARSRSKRAPTRRRRRRSACALNRADPGRAEARSRTPTSASPAALALAGRRRPPRRPAQRLAVRHLGRLLAPRRTWTWPSDATTGNAAGLALDVAPSSDEHLTLVDPPQHALVRATSPASLQSHAVTWSRGAGAGLRRIRRGALHRRDEPLSGDRRWARRIFPLASRTLEVNGQYGRPATLTPRASRSAWPTATARRTSGRRAWARTASSSSPLRTRTSRRRRPSRSATASSSRAASWRATSAPPAATGSRPRQRVRYTIGQRHDALRPRPVPGRRLDVAGHRRHAAHRVDRGEPGAGGRPAPSPSGFERNAGANSQLQIEVVAAAHGRAGPRVLRGRFPDRLRQHLPARREQRPAVQGLVHAAALEHAVGQRRRCATARSTAASPRRARPATASSRTAGRFWSARASVEVLPTHTGIAVLVRGRSSRTSRRPAAKLANDSDKLALSVSQDLSVIGLTPFGAGWKLLVAVENAQGNRRSPPRRTSPSSANRLLGGVAVSF